MTAFRSNVDVANRALQHCGADRITSFTDNSKRASEISFTYDKVREAELQRNTWTFATRRTVIRAIDTTTMLLVPALWSSTATYYRGCIVSDQSGNLWRSTIRSNLNNDPLLSSYWEPYFGPLTVSLYDATGATSYASGEIAYTFAGDGTYRVYQSLQDGATDNPSTGTAWSATATYFKDQIITYLGVAYKSQIDLNLNNQPNLTPATWSVGTTYAANAKVTGSDGLIYQSIGSGNIGHDPTLDVTQVYWTSVGIAAAWTTSFVGGTGSAQWFEIGGIDFPSGVSLTVLDLVYPIGAGPSTQEFNRNVFRLPAAFLKIAPQDPKNPVPSLGGPAGTQYRDWQIENGYIVTAETGPIALRFVANVVDVTIMHTMFCEGLAARLGLEVCQPITQSDARLQTIASIYKQWMGDARLSNAIEASYDDPPDDPFITVRA